MGKIAFVFSGQGAQHAGMGQDFYEHNETIRDLFEQAAVQMPTVMDLCFHGDVEQLKQTENTQPCLFLADLAAAMALRDEGVVPDGVAGFSLGEIPALTFAGAFTPLQGFGIARKRGEFMAQAAAAAPATMAAVLKLTDGQVEEACARFSRMYPANYNAPGQLVVSGAAEEMPVFMREIQTMGGRCIPLAVSGGFHSPFMDSAAEQFDAYLKTVHSHHPKLPVYANCTAELYGNELRPLMTRQVNHPVLWTALITRMIADGYDTFIEVGVGSTLQKLIGKIDSTVKSYAVETMNDIQNFKQSFQL